VSGLPTILEQNRTKRAFNLSPSETDSCPVHLENLTFAEITEPRIRRGTLRSVAELEDTVLEYVRTRNRNLEPFAWTTTKASTLLRKVRRARLIAAAVED
jgi:hypothetical protein